MELELNHTPIGWVVSSPDRDGNAVSDYYSTKREAEAFMEGYALSEDEHEGVY